MTKKTFRVGLVQMSSTNQVEQNMQVALDRISQVAACGAKLVMTPENTVLMEFEREALMAKTFYEQEDPSLPRFAAMAQDKGLWLLIGSMPIKTCVEGQEKLVNRSYLFSPDGAIAARYDKIHMFDVDLPKGQSYRESSSFQAGERAVVASLPWGRLGLSICYDLRFPALYRKLAQNGAEMISVPAAFTKVTGEAHWHVLLRARAIECGAFVFAPAQVGQHKNAKGKVRETFGHALIIDPWGNILDDGGKDKELSIADIDLSLVRRAREQIPSLALDRKFSVTENIPGGKI